MEGQKITVVIRKRPLGKKELAKGDQDIVQVRDTATVMVTEIKLKVDLTKYVEEHNFNFDLAFGEAIDNEQLYVTAVRPIIEAAFNKAKVTCFAYGQTGSGKTYTMLGDPDSQVPGLYLLATHDIFSMVQKPEYGHLTVGLSFYEIYCGKLYDLLNDRTQLTALEDNKGNVIIKGIAEKKVTNVQQIMQIIQYGQSTRTTASNSSNAESSRSHALLQINLKHGKQLWGKLSFIDLAGSERGADVQDQNKQTRVDGAEINKSLLALKECIRALDQNKNHTPFRGSKLTLVLKDSFTGNCRTVMIGNISPSNSSSEHTLNTLRYADRVKELKKPPEQRQQMDQMSRELGLARQTNNVVRRAYRNPDSDEDENDEQGMQGSLQKANSMQVPPQMNQHFTQQQINNIPNMQRTSSSGQAGQQQVQQKQQMNMQQGGVNLFQQQQQQGQFGDLGQFMQQQQQNAIQIPQAIPNKQRSGSGQQAQPQQQQQYNQPQYSYVTQAQSQPLGLPQQPQPQTQTQAQSQMQQLQQLQQQNGRQQPQQQVGRQQPQQFIPQIPTQQSTPPLPYQQQNNRTAQQQQSQQYQQQQLSQQQTPQVGQQGYGYQQGQFQGLYQSNNQFSLNNPPQQIQNYSAPVLNESNGYNNNLTDYENDNDEALLDDLIDPEKEVELQRLYNQHQELVQTILQEEDEVILMHREHIDEMVDVCKKDMRLLNSIESNAMHIQDYVRTIREQLIDKRNKIDTFIQKVIDYEALIEKEKEISGEYHNLKQLGRDNFEDDSYQQDNIQ